MLRKMLLGLVLVAPLSLYPLLRDSGASTVAPIVPQPPQLLTPDQQLVLGCFAVMPGQSLPAAFPWAPVGKLAMQESRELEELAQKDPMAFLQRCLDRYEKEVTGYRCMFHKQERVGGSLGNKEVVDCHFREKPFSVYMRWISGNNPLTGPARSVFVKGDDPDILTARPALGFPKTLSMAPTDKRAMATSRFPITEFGIDKGARSTLNGMRDVAASGKPLGVRYDGIRRVAEVGDRFCYKFVRTPFDPSDWKTELDKKEKLNELTIYIDLETQLQTGAVLIDVDKKLIAEYFFRDVQLNKFDEKQFSVEALHR